MDEEEEREPYSVGYGLPPVEHQFQPGAPSRNPSGRPKKGRDRKSVVRRVANELRRYSEGRNQRSATTAEIVILAVRNAAARGDLAALKLCESLMGSTGHEDSQIPKGVFFLPEKMEYDEWRAKYAPDAIRRPSSSRAGP